MTHSSPENSNDQKIEQKRINIKGSRLNDTQIGQTSSGEIHQAARDIVNNAITLTLFSSGEESWSQEKLDKVGKRYFPDAKDAKDTSIHYLGRMQIEHELDISRVLMATSVCSDDINVPSTTFFNVLFGPFIMGGLGGLPFAGQTGMTAFAHHIPDEGSAFIFYGPHIGITLDGELGKMYRPRQEETGNSCGALMLALSRFQDSK